MAGAPTPRCDGHHDEHQHAGRRAAPPQCCKTPPKGGKGGGPKKPITPVKVNQGRNWGPIAMFTAVGLLAAGIIGWGVWAAFRPGGAGYGWEGRAEGISGITHFTPRTSVASTPTTR
jgi:hypothetical protein